MLSAVPPYPMHSSLLPEATCNEIEKICRRFIRGETGGKERPPSQVGNSVQIEAGWWARTKKWAHLHLLRGLAGVESMITQVFGQRSLEVSTSDRRFSFHRPRRGGKTTHYCQSLSIDQSANQ